MRRLTEGRHDDREVVASMHIRAGLRERKIADLEDRLDRALARSSIWKARWRRSKAHVKTLQEREMTLGSIYNKTEHMLDRLMNLEDQYEDLIKAIKEAK